MFQVNVGARYRECSAGFGEWAWNLMSMSGEAGSSGCPGLMAYTVWSLFLERWRVVGEGSRGSGSKSLWSQTVDNFSSPILFVLCRKSSHPVRPFPACPEVCSLLRATAAPCSKICRRLSHKVGIAYTGKMSEQVSVRSDTKLTSMITSDQICTNLAHLEWA